MFRLQQIIQNLFIRFEGFLYRIFGFFRQIFGFLYQRFLFFLQLLGFTKSEYFLESNETKDTKSVENKQLAEAEPKKAQSDPTVTRRSNPQMDYYRNMARQVKTSK